jgi:aspartyl-tRNA(Asn)/glutamyl-tRNA(Gln) amidotransferase subunit A
MYSESIASITLKMMEGGGDRTAYARECLERIRRYNGELNAFTLVDEECTNNAGGGLLQGVPLAVKDLIDVAGQVNTAASNLLKENVARRDADVIVRMRNAGAIFVGRTNLHEFAYGGSGVISSRGPARNPWDTTRVTGGSSSGSAAAVAAGLCAGAIGTDTAGSIRLPATYCGIVGFKPTYAVVSTRGVIPLAESYDHVGPMTRAVQDARMLFGVMTGAMKNPRITDTIRVGVPEKYFYRDLDGAISDVMAEVLQTLRKNRCEIKGVDFDVDEDRTLASWESYQVHKPYVEKSAEVYQPETLRRIRSGEKITAEAAQAAKGKLQEVRAKAAEIFKDIDVMLTPTVPVLPAKIDELLAEPDRLRQRELLMLRNTRPFNVLGVPAISIPWDLSPEGLPVGIQLAAAPGQDFELLAIAEEFERSGPWQGRTPPAFS